MSKALFLMIFFTFSAWGQDWTPIVPISDCPDFKIEYLKQNLEYKIRYKKYEKDEFYYYNKTLKDINNLSLLTNELVDESYKFCPLSINLNSSDPEIDCLPENNIPINFNQDYPNLLNGLIAIIDETKNNCDDVASLIKLQSEIPQLDQNFIFEFDGKVNLLKLITNRDTDQMINHYYDCGGKDGSENLIKNIILIEAKKACLFPKPQGAISYEETLAIASEIANEYKDTGLIGLNSKTDEITKKAVLKLGKLTLERNVEQLFGNQINSRKFVDDLDIYKDLVSLKDKYSSDYASYILAPDAPSEIIDKGLIYILQNSLNDILPDNLSPPQKESIIKNQLHPIVKEKYKICSQDFAKTLMVNPKKPIQDKISRRKEQQKSFCKKNPKSCHASGCSQVINYGTERADIRDQDILQACILKGVSHSLKNVLELILKNQLDEYKDDIPFENDSISLATDKAYKNLIKCADKKLKKNLTPKPKELFLENIELLYHTDTNKFSAALNSCAIEVKTLLTKDMAILLIANMPVINENFLNIDNKYTSLLGVNSPKVSFDFARSLVNPTLNTCMKQQNRLNMLEDPSLCIPLIETKTAEVVIDNTIEDLLNKENISTEVKSKLRDNFKNCAAHAEKNLNNNFGNPLSSTPLNNQKDAEEYLKHNHDFFNCVKETIVNTSKYIAGKTLDDMEEELISDLKDLSSFRAQKDNIAFEVQSCFKEELNAVPNWPAFSEFNSRGGIDSIKKKCTERASEYALGPLVTDETTLAIGSLVNNRLIDIQMRDIAISLNQEQNLGVDPDSNTFNRDVIRAFYRKYVTENPDGKVNDFVSLYKSKAQDFVINNIRDGILIEVIGEAKPGYNFEFLNDIATPGCFNGIYLAQQENIEYLTEHPFKEKVPKDPNSNLKNEFKKILSEGLIRHANSGTLDKVENQIKELCANPQKYKSPKALIELGIADTFITQIIQDEIIGSLEEATLDQCFGDMDEYEIPIEDSLKNLICSTKNDKKNIKNIIKSTVNNKDYLAYLNLILDRKDNSIKLIRQNIKMKNIEEWFGEDSELLNYIYHNLPGVVHQDVQTMGIVKKLAIDKIFADRSKDSFADEFVKTQIIGAIGISGLKTAKDKVITSVSELEGIKGLIKENIEPRAKKSFYTRWNYQSLEHYVSWDNIDPSTKTTLVNGLIDSYVYPTVNPDLSENQKEKLQSHYTETVTNHALNYKIFKNPKFKEKTRQMNRKNKNTPKEMISFPEMLTQDITKDITEDLTETFFDKINPFNYFD